MNEITVWCMKTRQRVEYRRWSFYDPTAIIYIDGIRYRGENHK